MVGRRSASSSRTRRDAHMLDAQGFTLALSRHHTEFTDWGNPIVRWSLPPFIRIGSGIYSTGTVVTVLLSAIVLSGLIYIALARAYRDPLVPSECVAAYRQARTAADTAFVDARHVIRGDPTYRTCGALRLLRAMRTRAQP
jgi:hypothetical protein